MAGFKEGAISLKKRDTTLPADIGYIKIYVNSENKLYTVDEYGTSAFVDTTTSGTSGVGYTLITSGNNLVITTSGNNQIIDLKATGVTSGSYGSAVLIPILSIDKFGRILSASSAPISATGVGTVTSVSINSTTLSGGGTVTTSGTINIDLSIITTSGTHTKIVKDVYGRVTSGGTLTSADIPNLSPSQIVQNTSNRFVTDTQITNWNNAYTSAHGHTNKVYLDVINQNLSSASNVKFSSVSAASVSAVQISATYLSATTIDIGQVTNAEFQQLDGISANIQNQLIALSAVKLNKDELNTHLSTGIIDVDIPELIRSTDTIIVPSATIAIYSTDNFRGTIEHYIVTSAQFTIPRDGANHFIVVDYNNGNPIYSDVHDSTLINQSNIVACHIVWNVDGNIHAIGFDNKGEGLSNKIDRSIIDTTPYRRSVAGGLTLSEDGSRHILISQAVVYAGTTPNTIYGYNSTTDKITEVFHSAGVWSFSAHPNGVYENTKYDNGTNLVTAGQNKYVVRWIYRTIGDDKEIFIVYGTNEYNNVEAAHIEAEPNVPNIVNTHGYLVGRIIVQNGATVGHVETAFGIPFTAGTVTQHNDLGDIEGGDSVLGQFYHITSAQNLYLSGTSANIQNQLLTLSGTKVDKVTSITAGTMLSGGGDLTANRTISHQTVGTAGIYSNIVTNSTGHVTSARNLIAGDMPSGIDATKIADGSVTSTEFQYINSVSSNVQDQINSVSAVAFHTNRSNLDNINQNLSTTSNVIFASVSATNISGTTLNVGNISNTEFGYLDTVSANIQTQLTTLSGTKVSSTVTISGTSGLIGGGDLSTNRTISLPAIGAAGTYTKISTDVYGRVSAATNITSADVPTLPATKIGTGIIDDTEFNRLDGVSANIQTQLSNLSGSSPNKNTVLNFQGIYRDPATLTYQASLSYNPVSRQVSLSAPTSAYPLNLRGTPISVNGNLGTHSSATGNYFYYLDVSGTIQISPTPWNLLTDCPIALVYYNATQTSGLCFEERHAHDRNPEAHKQQHLSTGTFCNPYPSLGGYNLAPSSPVSADNIYTVTQFTLYDEDIRVDVPTHTSAIPKQVFYQSGATHDWAFDGYDPYGYSYGTYIKYNQYTGATYTLTELVSNEFTNYYVFGITSISATKLLTIPSTNKFSSLATAQTESFADILNANSLPLQEWVLLFKITYRTGNSYNTPGKCRIENVVAYTGTKAGTSLAGAGISQAFADSTYLRLDGSNDPITGDITIGANLSAINISATTITVGNISNTEFGYLDTVSANIQTQLTNLSATDSTKANSSVTITTTSGLTGGGDLTTNRTIGLVATGTAGTYTKVSTDAYGRISAATNITSADVPTLPATKIGAGIVDDTEFNRLDGISANIQTQLSNLSASNSSTISSLSAYQTRIEKGASLGYAALDSNSKLYTSAIPDFILGQLRYMGSWNAATNTPTLSSPGATSGQFYIVNVSGTTIPSGLNPNTSASLWPSGNVEWKVGDWIVSDGTYWDKVDNTDAIYSWNGRLGAVVPIAGDYTAAMVTQDSSNRFVTDTQISNWNLAYTSAHNHANKSTLDIINQSVNTSASVNFSSVSATNISGATLNVGNISNTEFGYLDTVSANIQTQLNSKQENITIAQNQVAIGGTNLVSGSNTLTFNNPILGIGLSAVVNNPAILLAQNPGVAGGAEIVLGYAGTQNDENSGKLYFGGRFGGPRIIGLTNNTVKHQRYNSSTSAYETVFGIESQAPNKDVTFYGDLLTISASNPRLVISGPDGVSKGVRFNDLSTIRWYAGTLQNNAFVIQDVTTNDYPISAISGSAGEIVLGGTNNRNVRLTSLNTSAVVVTNGSKNLVSSNTTSTQLGYLSTTSADVQTQINNLGANKYSTTINISATTGQVFTITHNLGYLRPIVNIVDTTNNQEIIVTPVYTSTSALNITLSSRVARNGVVVEIQK